MRYAIKRKIGSGGMAEIFLASARGPDGFERPTVLKRIRPELASLPLYVQLFIDEANLSARLSHPNIVHVYEFGKMSGAHFLAMELVSGRDLKWMMAHLQRRDALPAPAMAAEIARQCCLGLDYAHGLAGDDGKSLNIVHRDVSPSNIMVSVDGGVKLLDFGVARTAQAGRRTHTQAGIIKGKISYLSPEQLQRGTIDRRSDIFSLGIVLHELLTWNRLFHGDTDLETVKLLLEQPIPPPSARNRAVGSMLDRVVMKALERDPERRYQSAAEMAEDLERVLQRAHYPATEMRRLMRERFAPDAEDRTRRDPTVVRDGTMDAASLIIEDWTRGAMTSAPPPAGRSVVRKLAGGAAVAGALLASLTVVSAVQRRPEVVPAAPPPPPIALSIDSAPQGAQIVATDGGNLGTTPLVIEAARSRDRLEYQIRKEGFNPTTIQVIPNQEKPVFVILKPTPRAQSAAVPKRPDRRFMQARKMIDSF